MAGKCVLLLLTIASCVYFLRKLTFSSDLLFPMLFELQPGWLALSLLAGVVHILVLGWILSLLLGRPAISRTVAIFMASQMLKYLPGRVWGLAAQKALLGDEATLKGVVGANIVLAGIVVGSHVMGSISAWVWMNFGPWLLPAVIAGGAALISLAALVLRLLAGFSSWQWMAVWKKPAITRVMIIGCVFASVSAAAAWIMLLRGAVGYDWERSLSLYVSSSLSVIAGFFSLLPAGLGTREAALIWLEGLVPGIAPSEITAYAFVSRMWLLGLDAICATIGISWLAYRKVSGPDR